MPYRLTSKQIRIIVVGVFSGKDLKNWNTRIINEWADAMERKSIDIEQIIAFAEEAVDFWKEDGGASDEVKNLAKSLNHASLIYSSK
jgi:hypothetical protein